MPEPEPAAKAASTEPSREELGRALYWFRVLHATQDIQGGPVPRQPLADITIGSGSHLLPAPAQQTLVELGLLSRDDHVCRLTPRGLSASCEVVERASFMALPLPEQYLSPPPALDTTFRDEQT
jgi:hypothetical protein